MPYVNGVYKNRIYLLCGHGMVIDHITFDKELWESMKSNFEMFLKDFYINLFFSE